MMMMTAETSTDFEDYTKTSKDYDTCRQAVGVDVMLGAIAHVMGDETIKKASIVDIGCGTGNYALALSSYVGQVTGIEYNSGMYEQAVKKTKDVPNISIQQGSATNIPLPDGCCDIVICTQVLHHLPDSVPPNYPGVLQAVKEVYRILKDKGAYIINTASHEQNLAFFGHRLVPQVAHRANEKYPPVSVLHDQLTETGFNVQSVLAHCHESTLQMNIYKNIQGPFDEKWRNGVTSTFAMATPKELQEALANWREKIKNNTAKEFIEKCEAARKRIGETTTIVSYKEITN